MSYARFLARISGVNRSRASQFLRSGSAYIRGAGHTECNNQLRWLDFLGARQGDFRLSIDFFKDIVAPLARHDALQGSLAS